MTLTPEFISSLLKRLPSMRSDELDRLRVGVIQLGLDGTILAYNAQEEKLTGNRREDVVGKNFFHEVAPCTNVRSFGDRFREGVAAGSLFATFAHRFEFRMQRIDVQVTIYLDDATQTGWVLVSPKSA